MLFESNSFPTDWYGYLTNQLGHIVVGVFLVFVVNRAGFELLGEYPHRLHVWWLVTIFYVLVVEVRMQGWRGFDTVEDSVFTCCYGAGAPLWAFSEVSAGSPIVSGDIAALDVFFLIASLHLAVGVGYRAYRAIKIGS